LGVTHWVGLAKFGFAAVLVNSTITSHMS